VGGGEKRRRGGGVGLERAMIVTNLAIQVDMTRIALS